MLCFLNALNKNLFRVFLKNILYGQYCDNPSDKIQKIIKRSKNANTSKTIKIHL